jgi:hypothetical protein
MAQPQIHEAHKWENVRHVLQNTSCYTPRPLEAMLDGSIEALKFVKQCQE